MDFRFVTCLSTIFLDISMGLIIGISFSISTILLRGCVAKGYTLATQKNSGVYVPEKQYQNVQQSDTIMVFKYESSLYFTTVSHFKEELERAYENNKKLKSEQILRNAAISALCAHAARIKISVSNTNQQESNGVMSDANLPKIDRTKKQLKTIIVDCSAVNYIDVMGLDVIKQVREDFEILGVDFVLACCSRSMLKKLTDKGLYGSEESKLKIFVTVHDAFMAYNDMAKQVYVIENDSDDIKLTGGFLEV